MLKVYHSLKFTDHYYCYLNNNILLIKDNIVTIVDINDTITNSVIERYKDKEITDDLSIRTFKFIISDYLEETITNYSNRIKQLTELHKELNV